MQDEAGRCWPSYEKLAEQAHVSRRTAIRACHELESAGLISRSLSFNGKGQTTNLYEVLIKDIEPMPQDGAKGSDSAAPPSDSQSLPQCSTVTPPSDSQSPELKPVLTKVSKPKGLLVKPDKPATRPQTLRDLFRLLNLEVKGSDRVIITDGRLRKLKQRLKSFTPKQVIESAQNLGSDQYMQGMNDAGKRWGTIDYLLRNDENVAKYLELEPVREAVF
jgi:DNA-binding transcriptional MocR family regulator